MWDELSHADLEAAKEQLKGRREEMLRRHAAELSALESDRSEIETLDQLIDAFARKFKTTTSVESTPLGTRIWVTSIPARYTPYQASPFSSLKRKSRNFGSSELPTKRSGI